MAEGELKAEEVFMPYALVDSLGVVVAIRGRRDGPKLVSTVLREEGACVR